MPRLSEFYGIVISLYWAEHPPPHFHARYGEHRVAVTSQHWRCAPVVFPAGPCASSGSGESCTEKSSWSPGRTRLPMNPWVRLSRCHVLTDPIPVVTHVEVLHDFVVGLTFDDGSVGEVDLLPHLWGPVFEPLRDDPGLFAKVRVDADEGTIVWPNGADVAPETLYRESAATRTS